MELPSPDFRRRFALPLLIFLAACGGGRNENISASDGGTLLLPTTFSSEGRLLSTCSINPACSDNPNAPFFANALMAPAEGATLNGIVRLEVSGNEMANVELLPANGYTPKLGIFNLTGDKTRAWLDLDTTELPNGSLNARISAFNVPAGQPGAEIVAMRARTWTIGNATKPPTRFTAALVSAPDNGAAIRGTTRLEVRGSAIASVELLPAIGYAPKLAMFNVSADRTVAWLDFDSRSLPDGVRDVRISAFNVTQGQSGAVEIAVMPVRRWDFRNGFPFSASVTMAPLNGEHLSGSARLEVRGSGIENVELLPPEGYSPVYGRFSISADKTFAWLDWDTTMQANGALRVRLSAFNTPAGSLDAREIISMPVREWVTNNP
jgi:hypothetical protein